MAATAPAAIAMTHKVRPVNGVVAAFVAGTDAGREDGTAVATADSLKTYSVPFIVPVTRRPPAIAGDAQVSLPRS